MHLWVRCYQQHRPSQADVHRGLTVDDSDENLYATATSSHSHLLTAEFPPLWQASIVCSMSPRKNERRIHENVRHHASAKCLSILADSCTENIISADVQLIGQESCTFTWLCMACCSLISRRQMSSRLHFTVAIYCRELTFTVEQSPFFVVLTEWKRRVGWLCESGERMLKFWKKGGGSAGKKSPSGNFCRLNFFKFFFWVAKKMETPDLDFQESGCPEKKIEQLRLREAWCSGAWKSSSTHAIHFAINYWQNLPR